MEGIVHYVNSFVFKQLNKTRNFLAKAIQMEIMQNGPVQANLRVYEDFLYYKKGEIHYSFAGTVLSVKLSTVAPFFLKKAIFPYFEWNFDVWATIFALGWWWFRLKMEMYAHCWHVNSSHVRTFHLLRITNWRLSDGMMTLVCYSSSK